MRCPGAAVKFNYGGLDPPRVIAWGLTSLTPAALELWLSGVATICGMKSSGSKVRVMYFLLVESGIGHYCDDVRTTTHAVRTVIGSCLDHATRLSLLGEAAGAT